MVVLLRIAKYRELTECGYPLFYSGMSVLNSGMSLLNSGMSLLNSAMSLLNRGMSLLNRGVSPIHNTCTYYWILREQSTCTPRTDDLYHLYDPYDLFRLQFMV